MRTQAHVLVRGLFGLISLAAALAGGWYALQQTSSWALAVFVVVIAGFVLGRGVPDVITDPDKGRRIAFFGLPPLFAVSNLVAVYELWQTWWLAVAIGFVAYFVGFFIASAVLPRIAAEEHADDLSRIGMGGRADHVGVDDAGSHRSMTDVSDKYGNRL